MMIKIYAFVECDSQIYLWNLLMSFLKEKVGFFIVGRTDRVKLGIHHQQKKPKCLFKSRYSKLGNKNGFHSIMIFIIFVSI
jgi:hypothetical protein